MKILVYNCQEQYALSRSQVETIAGILPKEYFKPIKEFHLSHDKNQPEMFEFNYKTKVAYFAYQVKEKTGHTYERAVNELLIGLARIKAKSKFGIPLHTNERNEYASFAGQWQSKCLSSLSK